MPYDWHQAPNGPQALVRQPIVFVLPPKRGLVVESTDLGRYDVDDLEVDEGHARPRVQNALLRLDQKRVTRFWSKRQAFRLINQVVGRRIAVVRERSAAGGVDTAGHLLRIDVESVGEVDAPGRECELVAR